MEMVSAVVWYLEMFKSTLWCFGRLVLEVCCVLCSDETSEFELSGMARINTTIRLETRSLRVTNPSLQERIDTVLR